MLTLKSYSFAGPRHLLFLFPAISIQPFHFLLLIPVTSHYICPQGRPRHPEEVCAITPTYHYTLGTSQWISGGADSADDLHTVDRTRAESPRTAAVQAASVSPGQGPGQGTSNIGKSMCHLAVAPRWADALPLFHHLDASFLHFIRLTERFPVGAARQMRASAGGAFQRCSWFHGVLCFVML